MEVKIIITASKNHLGAYAENLEGVTAGGETIHELKQNIKDCIQIQKELGNIEDIEYTFAYSYDTGYYLNYYNKIISMVALERLTGINQKQLHHYAMGIRKPRPATKQKIQKALNNIGKELSSLQLT